MLFTSLEGQRKCRWQRHPCKVSLGWLAAETSICPARRCQQPAGWQCRRRADAPQIGRAPLPGWRLPLVNSSLLVLYFSQQLSQEPWHLFISPPSRELTCRMGKRFAGGPGGESFLASVKSK